MTNSSALIPGNIPALVALLEHQRSLYQQLRTLSDQQGTLVAQAQAEALLGLLAQRQKLIDHITTVNAELDPYRKRWTELWGELADGQRRQIGSIVQEVQDLLGAIIQQDERDRQTLQTAKGRIAVELQKLSRAGQAIQAYRTSPATADPSVGGGNNRFTNQNG